MQHNNPLPTEILNLLPTLTPLQLAWLSGYAWSQASGVDLGGRRIIKKKK